MTVRNGGEWTEARFNSFVKSALRAASRRWPPKYSALNAACLGVRTNAKTGRQAKHYVCKHCSKAHPGSDVQVDHIDPVINPKVGFESWDAVIAGLFCERDRLQVLCKDCHHAKTQLEKAASVAARKERKNAG